MSPRAAVTPSEALARSENVKDRDWDWDWDWDWEGGHKPYLTLCFADLGTPDESVSPGR